MTPDKPKRKPIDWEAVEREYRAGQLSIREIARNAGCAKFSIERRAAKMEWTRDLTNAVRLETKRKVMIAVAKEVAAGHTPAIIEAASNRGAEVLTNQIKRIQDQYELIDSVNRKIKEEDLAGGGLEPRDVGALINNCSAALARLIPLERQAFNITDGGIGEVGIKDKAHIDAIAAAAKDES